MDKQYVMVSGANRQKIRIEPVGLGGFINSHYVPEDFIGSVETFPYRFGKIGLIHPVVVEFHRRVLDGDKKAVKLWTILWESEEAKQLRNNFFWSRDYEERGNSFLFCGDYNLARDELPVLFYDREEFGDEKCDPFRRYFVSGLRVGEFDRIDKLDIKRILRSSDKEEVHNQLEMLRRYEPNMLPPHEIMLEATRREVCEDELNRRLEDARKTIEFARKPKRSVDYSAFFRPIGSA